MDPALDLDRERAGGAAHGEQVGGQRAGDVERARERPVMCGVDVRRRRVAKHEAEDPGGRERGECRGRLLALVTSRIGLAALRVRLVPEARGREPSRVSAFAFVARGLARRSELGDDGVVSGSQLRARLSDAASRARAPR